MFALLATRPFAGPGFRFLVGPGFLGSDSDTQLEYKRWMWPQGLSSWRRRSFSGGSSCFALDWLKFFVYIDSFSKQLLTPHLPCGCKGDQGWALIS